MSDGTALGVWWRGAAHVWMRNLVVYRKTWALSLLPNFFEPVFYLVGLGIGLGAYVTRSVQGLPYLEFIAPGLIAANAMNGGSFETTYNVFVKMSFQRTYEAVTATPVNIEDAMVGEVLWAVTRAMVYGFIFAVVVVAMGLAPWWTLAALVPVVAVTGWLFAGIGLLFTSFVKVIDLYSFYYTLWLTPLFLFSGIFFPVQGLPHWAQIAAWFTPLYHCVNLAQAVVHGTWGPSSWVDVAWTVVVAAITTVWAVWRIRRRVAV